MWEWFLPKSERHLYQSDLMEGPHGGSGRPFREEWEDLGWGMRIVWVFSVIFCVAAVVGFAWLVLNFMTMPPAVSFR